MHEKHERWDVLVPGSNDAVLWAAYGICSRLALAGHRRVRLFIDAVAQVSRHVPSLHPTAWVQEHLNFEVLKYDLAEHCLPASNVVQVHGSVLPEKYSDLLSSGSGKGRLFNIQPLSESSGPLAARNYRESTSLTVYRLQQGDLPTGSGMVKDLRAVHALRRKWQRDSRCKEASLSILGVNFRISDDLTIIYVAEALGSAWRNFIEALNRVGRQYLVLAGAGAQRNEFKELAMRQHANVRICLLPELLWAQMDEVVWLSDMTVTGDEDIALRAARCGCPLVWLSKPGQEPDFFARWYTRRCDPVQAPMIHSMFHSVATGSRDEILTALAWYQAHWNEVTDLASGVLERIFATADIVDVMLGLAAGGELESAQTGFLHTVPLDAVLAAEAQRA